MKLRLAAIALAAVTGLDSGQVDAQVKADSAPDWLKKPSSEDLIKTWPAEAWRRNQGGSAVINCKVAVTGTLFDCYTKSETPSGSGFGSSALALSPQFLLKPALKNGQPVVVDVNIPVMFSIKGVREGAPPGDRNMLPIADLVQAPAYADVVAAFPVAARTARVGGSVALICKVEDGGQLGGCDVVTEAPKKLGFADAAKALAPKFAVPATFSDGQPTRGMLILLPLNFDLSLLGDTPAVAVPIFKEVPAGSAFARAYPKTADTERVQVVLNCRGAAGGQLEDCRMESESPAGLGYGVATIGLAPDFRVGVWSATGTPIVGSRVQVAINYRPR